MQGAKSMGKSERSGPHIVVLACKFNALLLALRSLTLAGDNPAAALPPHRAAGCGSLPPVHKWDMLLDTLDTRYILKRFIQHSDLE